MTSATPLAADIRQASAADVPAIQRVARRSLADSCSFLGQSLLDRIVEEWYTDAAVNAAIERPDVTYVVACTPETPDGADEGGELVGYATAVQTTATEGAVPSLAVDPDHWGEGIGTALIERLITTLHRRGVSRVETTVFADSEVGVDFCESRGFERAGEREADLPEGSPSHREYVYTSDLSASAKP
ncbi:GNAT family N-acetyltransferase [Halomarina litorea]|uniref:GNAT family N-acetyltransferase n=1 Tax=Halomarina litorea TaxID=2961595 RepID=UPI0020C57727|nr:GNAT family N-acetyltransferase [Halomarina sp. BCD28]